MQAILISIAKKKKTTDVLLKQVFFPKRTFCRKEVLKLWWSCFADVALHLFWVNKSVSKVLSDLYSEELRSEKKKTVIGCVRENNHRVTKHLLSLKLKATLLLVLAKLHWGPIIWCSLEDDFDSCLIAKWSCWEIVFEGHPAIVGERDNFLLPSISIFSPKWDTMRGKMTCLNWFTEAMVHSTTKHSLHFWGICNTNNSF